MTKENIEFYIGKNPSVYIDAEYEKEDKDIEKGMSGQWKKFAKL